jgi:subtilisin family serine protease
MNPVSEYDQITLPTQGGKGVRVAVVDSGINPHHSHVRGVSGGTHIRQVEGGTIECDNDHLDMLGHGTAVAGIIRAKAPEAELYSVKVFDRELRTHAPVIAAAIRWAVENNMDVINVSLGTSEKAHTELLWSACCEADARGLILVAATEPGSNEMYPATFTNVIAVVGDENCGWDEHYYDPGAPDLFRAHPSPRPLPGRPQCRNLKGHSFAAAHITALAARLRAENPLFGREEIIQLLVGRAIPASEFAVRWSG